MNATEFLTSEDPGIPMEINTESTDEGQDTNYQTILFEAYASIGEPDAVYGAGSGLSTDFNTRIHTYEEEKCWGKALRRLILNCEEICYMITPLSWYILLIRTL